MHVHINNTYMYILIRNTCTLVYISNEVHRKTDTLFPGNNMTATELEPLTI